jgi:tyrosyl-tRNA synthetase
MYGKVMSIPDALIMNYFELATEVPEEEIAAVKKEMASGANPRDLKMRLARAIVSLYHPKGAAEKAEEVFIKTFQKKEVPDQVEEKKVKAKALTDVLVEVGFADSKSEARRTVDQSGVKVDGIVAEDPLMEIKSGVLIQKGKRFFVRIK